MLARTAWWLLTIAGSAAVLALLWLTEIPLGIPGEWVWLRLPTDEQSGLNAMLAGMVALGYVGVVFVGGQRLGRGRVLSVEIVGWLTVLVGIAAAWLWTVQETAPPEGQWAKGPFVLYYPSSSGYFYHVRYHSPDAGKFLGGYEKLMSAGDVLHVGTHPPGLFLVFHGLIAFQEAFPGIAIEFFAWAPESFREAMAIIRENSAQTPYPAEARDAITLWLASLLALACAAATVVPLYVLLRLSLPRDAAWYAASLWPTIPVVAIFLPKSDAAYPLISTALVTAVLLSWRGKSLIGAFAAGAILWLGLLASLAFLPVLLFAGLCVVVDRWSSSGVTRWSRGEVAWLLAAAAGFLMPVGLMACLADVNLPAVWLWNYRNHAGFYQQFTRTWWAWLLINPLELTFAVGFPLASLAVRSGVLLFRQEQSSPDGPRLALLGIAVWGVLWLSGKNSGEAARLWLLLMPGVVWLAGQGLVRRDSTRQIMELDRRLALGSLTLALIVGLLTVHRVGGFHLGAG